jgi:hypothetical protein
VKTRNVLKILQYSDQSLHLIMLQAHHLDDSHGLMLQALSPANPPIRLDITSIVGDVRREVLNSLCKPKCTYGRGVSRDIYLYVTAVY